MENILEEFYIVANLLNHLGGHSVFYYITIRPLSCVGLDRLPRRDVVTSGTGHSEMLVH